MKGAVRQTSLKKNKKKIWHLYFFILFPFTHWTLKCRNQIIIMIIFESYLTDQRIKIMLMCICPSDPLLCQRLNRSHLYFAELNE